MVRKKGRYPSQVRYDKKHPTISIRVNKKTYDAFKELLRAEKKTGKEFLIACIQKQHSRYKKRFRDGLAKGTKRIPFFYCTRCGGEEYITSLGPYQKMIFEIAEKESWICRMCATELER